MKDYLETFLQTIAEQETQKTVSRPVPQDTRTTLETFRHEFRYNKDTLVKTILIWLVGAFVSMGAIALFVFLTYDGNSNFMRLFFSNKDIYLVVTTLTVSAYLEVIFSQYNTIAKKIVVAIGFLLILANFTLYVIQIQQYGFLSKVLEEYSWKLSILLIIVCFVYSVLGYIMSCKEKAD